jgi:phosphoribosylanthranilate isomerase
MSEKKPEDLKLPNVEILLANFIGILGNKAYDSLGLIPKEGTKIDLNQAKLAIDSMNAMIEVVGPMVDKKQSQELRNLLASLRMSYVQRAGNYVPPK